MTDRELLELAAKAAGAKQTDYSDKTPDHWVSQHSDGVWRKWNPRTDYCDALRLAVKLDIRIAPGCVSWGDGEWLQVVGDSEEEYMAALLRAITRAAAEIGKAMK